jgi:hypothetical protein
MLAGQHVVNGSGRNFRMPDDVRTEVLPQTAGGLDRWTAKIDLGDGRLWRSLGIFVTERQAHDAINSQLPAMIEQVRDMVARQNRANG